MTRLVTVTLATFAVFCLLAAVPLAGTQALAAEDTSSSMAMAQGEGHDAPVDLNSASPKELRALPGIGQAYSKKIIEHRPYKSVEELRTRNVLPLGTYSKIRDKVVANGK